METDGSVRKVESFGGMASLKKSMTERVDTHGSKGLSYKGSLRGEKTPLGLSTGRFSKL